MKKTLFLLLLLVLVSTLTFLPHNAKTQELTNNTKLILHKRGHFDPKVSVPTLSFNYPSTQEFVTNKKYYVVQKEGVIDSYWRDRLKNYGEIVSYLHNNAYVLSTSSSQTFSTVGSVRWYGSYSPAFKLDPTLDSVNADSIAVTVSLFRDADNSILEFVGGLPKVQRIGKTNNFYINKDVNLVLATVARIEGVEFISELVPAKVMNDNAIKIVQTGGVNSTPLYANGLNGSGEVYGSADSGVDSDHNQFRFNAQSTSQTLSKALVWDGTNPLPTTITNPNNKILSYFLLGVGNTISMPSNPNGGISLDPNQMSGPRYLNAVAYDDSSGGFHGTTTNSVAVGKNYLADGSGNVVGMPTRTNWDGVAPEAKIVFQDVGHPSGQLPGVDFIRQDFLHEQAYNSGVRIHNNSYGTASHNFTQTLEVYSDYAMWYLRDYLAVFAVGNSGPNQDTAGNVGKNSLIVGACDSPTSGGNSNNVSFYSSHGSIGAGRYIPNIIAPGLVKAAAENSAIPSSFGNNTSKTALDAAVNPSAPNNTNHFIANIGTSFASPAAAGTALLVRQYFRTGYYPNGSVNTGQSFIPSNALIKGILINSADNMSGNYTADSGSGSKSRPSYGQGWGILAADNSLYFTGDTRKLVVLADIYNGAITADNTRPAPNPAIMTGQTHVYKVGVQSPDEDLKITLNWSDVKPNMGDTSPLINDLNLEITSPTGSIYRGNLNFLDGFSNPISTSFDTANNTENIFILFPEPGIWTVKVIGANIPGNGDIVTAQPGNQTIESTKQGYALIATGSVVASPSSASTSVDSASYVQQSSRGELMSAFGAGFPTGLNINQGVSTTPLPTNIANVSVRVNGILAPLLFVGVGSSFGGPGAFQINYEMPYETVTGTAYLEILYNGSPVAAETLVVYTSAPGVFTFSGTGVGQANCLNFPSYSPNGVSNPAPKGSTVICYANGTGNLVNGNPGSGNAAPSSPLYTTNTPTVSIGGVNSTNVSFSGLAPGFVSLWQLNLTVPSNAPSGSQDIRVTLNGRTSKAGVSLYVQ